jgi:hypothetical protein
VLASSLALAREGRAAPWSYRVVGGGLEDARDRWVASDSGAIVEVDGRVILRLRAGTILRAERKAARLALGGEGGVRTYRLELISGTLDVEDPMPTPDARQAVMVQAPRSVTGTMLGGRMIVAAMTGRATVANKAGVVWVGSGSGWRSLGAGTAWSSSRAVVSPYPLTPPPILEGSRHAWSGITSPVSIDGLRWSPVDGALRYVVRLEGPGDPEPFDTLEAALPVQPRAFRPAGPGAYTAKVAAVDANGIEGAPSEPLRLAVVGMIVPPGATIGDDDSLRISDREVATLTHAGGLLASYGTAQGIPAPTAVKLFRGESTLFQLRDPRDREGFDFVLAPRRLALRVQAGPKTVRWPGEPVEITIDAVAGTLPDSVEVRPTVTVGVEPVPLEFQRDGRGLHAALQAPRNAGPGPWVVRVDVADQYGHFLGRDFVEVGVTARPSVRPHGAAAEPAKRSSPAAAQREVDRATTDAS